MSKQESSKAGMSKPGVNRASTSKSGASKQSQASVRAGGEGPIRVLLAEDEESFIDALVIGLTNEGFRVIVARDGAEALRLYDETDPDILLLDLMLPKMSGVDVCRAIRTRSRVPIIMVTAKGTEIDTVVALEMGADDYVTKPYRLRELVARMRAVLRRAPGGPDAVEQGGPVDLDGEGVWEASGIKMDFDQRRAFVRGEEVHLRRKEFELLRLLVENSGRGPHPRRPHRPGVGYRLHRRHQDTRRAHQAAAVANRGRSFRTRPHHHRAGRRLPLRRAHPLKPSQKPMVARAACLHWGTRWRMEGPG